MFKALGRYIVTDDTADVRAWARQQKSSPWTFTGLGFSRTDPRNTLMRRFAWGGQHVRHLHRDWYALSCRCGQEVDQIEIPFAGNSPCTKTFHCPSCSKHMTWKLYVEVTEGKDGEAVAVAR